MRLISLKLVNDWYEYTFSTTYRNSWQDILFICKTLSLYHDRKGIFTGDKEWTLDDLNNLAIPEESSICFLGRNKVYDNIPFQYVIYNQLDTFVFYVPKDYVNSLKRSETEFLTEEEKIHTFDRFTDSIELNSVAIKMENTGYNKLYQAFEFYKKNFTDGETYVFKDEDAMFECNISKLFNERRKIH